MSSNLPKLTLFMRPMCGFCHRVQKEIRALGMDVDERNIWSDREAAEALNAATGRSVVPVLHIKHDDSDMPEWLPESADIIAYLRQLSADNAG